MNDRSLLVVRPFLCSSWPLSGIAELELSSDSVSSSISNPGSMQPSGDSDFISPLRLQLQALFSHIRFVATLRARFQYTYVISGPPCLKRRSWVSPHVLHCQLCTLRPPIFARRSAMISSCIGGMQQAINGCVNLTTRVAMRLRTAVP